MHKLKFLATIVCTLLFSFTSFAWCGYTDKLHINSNAPNQTRILLQPLVDDKDLTSYMISKKEFAIADTKNDKGEDNCASGHATVRFGTDEHNYCNLTFYDSSSISDPRPEHVDCHGNFQFMGITYDGTWSYRYTLHFGKLSYERTYVNDDHAIWF